ncbi:DnaJ domain-containing protein [Candidiatus Paracoxiella cheracis]|uniref:DnaJ domain-containing protein n=1 Tax=Candidiatus Paracoxiella cheracis TaxID=3405120 RepID=UPI003BF45DD7
MRDLYEALGITADSTQEAIKRAYRNQARLFHPDVGGSHERMTVINQAYATLSNPEARRQFDQRRAFFQDE